MTNPSSPVDDGVEHADEADALLDEALAAIGSVDWHALLEMPPTPEQRMVSLMAQAESAGRSADHAAAKRVATVIEALDEAARHPEVFVVVFESGPSRELLDLAHRAAVADLAVRLRIAEGTVVQLAAMAETLRTRAPEVWRAFRDGGVSLPNARVVAEVLDGIHPDLGIDEALDLAAADLAHLAPARFRRSLRTIRDRLHPEPLAARQARAAEDRRMLVEHVDDGMAWLNLYVTGATAERIRARVDTTARHLAAAPDETRTMDQLRADVAGDLLTGGGTGAEVNVELAVTVPMLTLLGRSDEPGTLDGITPIDADTARELAVQVPSFARILTHPVRGTILDVDRRTYRFPANLKRWLLLHHTKCSFAGCGRRSSECDLDHTIQWSRGGVTAASNATPICEPHHIVKDSTRWRAARAPDGRLAWTSPTGATVLSDPDPPPF